MTVAYSGNWGDNGVSPVYKGVIMQWNVQVELFQTKEIHSVYTQLTDHEVLDMFRIDHGRSKIERALDTTLSESNSKLGNQEYISTDWKYLVKIIPRDTRLDEKIDILDSL